MPVIGNFSCDLNEALQITVTVTADGTPTGTPVNVTGWNVQMTIHKEAGDGLSLKTYSVGSGIAIPAGTDGRIVVTVPNSDIAALRPGTFAYFVARTDYGAEADLRRGLLTINPV